MSRCFPYPPPGYSLKSAASHEEALIESIKFVRVIVIDVIPPGSIQLLSPILILLSSGALKLQKENEIAKAERKKEKKDKKREKKEKKRESKAKEESNYPGNFKPDQEAKGKFLFKCLDDEQLERSSLTEEHGPAVCSQNSSCSSDSTQNSNKRKRPASPSEAGIHANGNIIRIRLSKKSKQVEASTSKENYIPKPVQQDSEYIGGAKTTAVRVPTERVDQLPKTASKQSYPFVSALEPTPSTSGYVSVDEAEAPSCSKVHENDIGLQYKNLIEKWLPPTIPSVLECDDQDWLFQTKPKPKRVEERNSLSHSSTTTCGSLSLWPRAQYLPDADVYAMPFTIPF